MNITNKTKYLIVGTVIAVAFLAVVALPASTNACGSYDCGYSYNPRPYQYNISYSYVPPAPVYQQPVYQQPVYVQQPVYQQPVIIQQPVVQPVYITQPVIQQPVVVQQPVYVQPQVIQPVVQQPVVIQRPIVQQPIYQQSNYNLDVGCYVDPTNARINQPVTWSVEVVGGMAPYTYNWSGTDNLTGSMSSVTKYYNTSGSKSAIVSVTSADGRTATRACSNSLTIAGAPKYSYKAPVKAPVTAEPVVTNNSTQAAATIFSLSNVPWGWVAILVILVLFVTVMYLLLNRQKI